MKKVNWSDLCDAGRFGEPGQAFLPHGEKDRVWMNISDTDDRSSLRQLSLRTAVYSVIWQRGCIWTPVQAIWIARHCCVAAFRMYATHPAACRRAQCSDQSRRV